MQLKYVPIIMLTIVSLFMTVVFLHNWPAADEMVFIRVVEHLPAYRSYVEWWSLDGQTHPSIIVNDPSTATQYDLTQNMLMWSHPQVAAYLAYPLVKLLNIDNPDTTNASITNKVHVLRLVASLILILSMLGIYYLLNKRFANNPSILTICMMPFITMLVFFTWQGNNWFYPDTFFTIFLTAALVVRETKYRKYIYIPLALMTGCTIYAVLFLIPFIIENKKTALCILALVPFWLQSYLVSGNLFYPYWHFISIGGTNSSVGYLTNTATFLENRLQATVDNIKLAWALLVFAFPPYLYLTYGYIRHKTNLFYILLMGFALIVGLTWWRQFYLMLPIAYLAPLLLRQALDRPKTAI